MAKSRTHKSVIQERKERERRRRVEDILKAAQKVFFTKGYFKATMDEIAFAAEISKPTIYQYFKNKDELYFSLMRPVVEEIGAQMRAIEQRLSKKEYTSGTHLVRDVFKGFFNSYEVSPETFKVVQMFQQGGLVARLQEHISTEMDELGRKNFEISRRLFDLGMKQGLIRKLNVHQVTDVLWGMFVGIVQLEDVKAPGQKRSPYLAPTLQLAEDVMVLAMATDAGSEEEGKEPAKP